MANKTKLLEIHQTLLSMHPWTSVHRLLKEAETDERPRKICMRIVFAHADTYYQYQTTASLQTVEKQSSASFKACRLLLFCLGWSR
jgi:hypothetical protein